MEKLLIQHLHGASMCHEIYDLKLSDKEQQAQEYREVIDTMFKHIKIDVSTFEVAEKAQEIIDSYEDVTCEKIIVRGHQIA